MKQQFFGVARGVPVTFEQSVVAHKHGQQASRDCVRPGVDPCDGCEARCLAYPDRPLDCPFLTGADGAD